MENILLYNTFLYRALLVFILVPHLTDAMELQTTLRQSPIDLEAGRHNTTALSPELVKHIQDGNVVPINDYFTEQTEHTRDFGLDAAKRNQLIKALEYANAELAREQGQRAKKKCDNCFARYKSVIFPTVLVAYSVVNITLSVLSYCRMQQPPSSIDIASLSINIIGSALPGIAFSGYEAIKHLRRGLQDTHQRERIDRVQKSHVVLQLLTKLH